MYALPDLPYPHDALDPYVSVETLRTHHGKHHKTYVEKTNDLAQSSGLAGRSLEEVVREAHRRGDRKLFNNAAQAWNHAFFWECMTPEGAPPAGDLAMAMEAAFGGLAALREKFVAEGAAHFGSGWIWLIADKGELRLVSTHDAGNVLAREGVTPLLVCDLWEHAYYLDYKNDRKAFLERWFDNVANWAFAAAQFAASDGQGDAFRYPPPEADQPAAGREDRPTA